MANLLSTSITGTLSTTGNTGIGTTSPVSLLNLNNGDAWINVTDTLRGLQFGYAGPSHGSYRAAVMGGAESYGGTDSGMLTFHTQNGYVVSAIPPERMRITSAGNVGIGTTAPTAKLQVAGVGAYNTGIIADGNATDGVGLALRNANGHDWYLISTGTGNGGGANNLGFYDSTAGAYLVYFKGDGKVGIGTTNPSTILTISKPIDSAAYGSGTQALDFKIYYPGYDIDTVKASIYVGVSDKGTLNTQGGYLGFMTSNDGTLAERLRIEKNGNVGIGTASPGTKLDVAGNARFGGTDTYNSITINNNSNTGGGGILLQRNGVNNAYLGALGWYQGTSNSGAVIGTDNSSYPIVFYTNVEQMRITGGGNVGIGVTNPYRQLSLNNQISNGSAPIASYGAGSATGLGQNFFNGYYASDSDGLGPYPRYFDIVSTGYPDGSNGGSNIRFFTNPIALNSPAVPRMVITSAGNVGIGTTSPAEHLSIEGAGDQALSIYSSTTGVQGTARTFIKLFGQNTASTKHEQVRIASAPGATASTAGQLIISTNNTSGDLTERLRIDESGNVGIGTTAPSYKLQVASAKTRLFNVSIGGTDGGTYNAYSDSVVGFDNLHLAAQGSGAVYINTALARPTYINPEGGNVTMNTTTSSTTGGFTNTTLLVKQLADGTSGGGLHIQQASTDNVAYFGFTGSVFNIGTSYRVSGSYQPIAFVTNGVDRLRILNNGNIGIGTTAPGSTLSVNGSNSGSVPLVDLVASGSGAFQRGVRMLNSSMVAGDSIMYSAGQRDNSKNMGQFYFYYAGDGSNSNRISMGLHSVDDVFNITGAGNVGIGTTTPGFKLEIVGGTLLTGTANATFRAVQDQTNFRGVALGYDTSGQIGIIYPETSAAASTLAIWTYSGSAWGERMRINGSGNVGIGTTSPSDKLDVSGNARTSGYVLVNNHSDNTLGYRIANTSGTSVSAMFTNSSNALVIAAGAVDQINLNKKVYVNAVALGVNFAPSATAGRIDASNDIVAFNSSDERLKENITPIANALDKVKSLTGVEFDWKPEHKEAHGHEGRDTGIIAQQVLAVMPTAVRTNDTGYLAVRYEKLIGLLIEGMKEQQTQIDELKAKLDGLTN